MELAGSNSNIAGSPVVAAPSTLYKYVSTATAKAILHDGTLRCYSPLSFNDPLDSQGDPYWFARNPIGLTGLCDADRKCRDPGRTDAMDMYLDTEVNRKNPPIAPEILNRERLGYLRRLRMLCTSTAEDLPMMWSHYANQHEGVVLGFDRKCLESRFTSTFGNVPHRTGVVNYSDDPPMICTFEEFLGQGLGFREWDGRVLEFMFTKKDCWRCENEWRLVAQLDRDAIGEYAPLCVRDAAAPVSITKGCRTHPREWELLQALAMGLNPNIEFRVARVEMPWFSVTIHSMDDRVLRQRVP